MTILWVGQCRVPTDPEGTARVEQGHESELEKGPHFYTELPVLW